MSRWTSITVAELNASKIATILEAAVSQGFDTDRAIANAVARIRAAVSAGNQLDEDTTKIPASLEDIALRMVHRAAKRHIGSVLTQDERDDRKEDLDYLAQLVSEKLRVETPDDPGATDEVAQMHSIEAVDVPDRLTGRDKTSGL